MAFETRPPTYTPVDATRPPTEMDVQPLSAAESIGSLPGYELAEEIGRGGMGIVYRARDLALNREVAVKVLQERYAPQSGAAARFIEEAQITSQLQHPGIPAVYHVGRRDGDSSPFLAMKLIKGDTLHDMLKEGASLNVLAVFEAVAQAVGFAHAHGVIHRDLKPHNIMVGAFGEVQVMDWGLAKVLTAKAATAKGKTDTTQYATHILTDRESTGSETYAGSIMGTPAYMPPEQAAGLLDQVSERSDVFGLGAILCQMLTGVPPFAGADGEAVRRNAVRGKMDEAWAKLDACEAAPDVVALCKKCLSFEPEDRPDSAGVLATQIAALRAEADERAKQAELEQARAAVHNEEQKKRRRVMLIAAGVAVGLLSLGVIGTTIGLLQAKEQRAFAEANEKRAREEQEKAEEQRLIAEEQKRVAVANEREATKQRGIAVVNEKEATNQRGIAVAVKTFLLNDLLSQADSTTQADRLISRGGTADGVMENPTIKHMLLLAEKELTADRIDRKFPGQPLVQAEALETIGLTFEGISEFQRAIDPLERAGKLRETTQGPLHADTLSCWHNLARAYHDASRVTRAIPLFEKVRKARLDTLGADDRDTLSTRRSLALAYIDDGRFTDAMDELTIVREKQKAVLPENDPDILKTLNYLGIAYSYSGNQSGALELLEDVHARQAKHPKLGASHPATLQTLNNIASVHLQTGQPDHIREAIRIHNELLTTKKRIFGADHSETLAAKTNLGIAYRENRQFDLAIPLLEESHAKQVEKLGAAHANTIQTLMNLAFAHFYARNFDRAVTLLEQVLDLEIAAPDANRAAAMNAFYTLERLLDAYKTSTKPPGDVLVRVLPSAPCFTAMNILDPATHGIIDRLIARYESLGRYDCVETWRRRLVDAENARKTVSSAHAEQLLLWGQTLLALKRTADMERAFQEYLAIQHALTAAEKATRPASAAYARQLFRLGESLYGLKQYAVVEGIMTECLEVRRNLAAIAEEKDAGSVTHSRHRALLGNTLVLLGTTRLALQNYAAAKEVLAECVAIRQQLVTLVEQEEPAALAGYRKLLADSLVLLGRASLGLKSYVDAETAFRDYLTWAEPNAWQTANVQSQLGDALLGQKKYDEAERMLLAGYNGLMAQLAAIPPASRHRPREAVQRLIAFYTAKKDAAQVAEWTAKLPKE